MPSKGAKRFRVCDEAAAGSPGRGRRRLVGSPSVRTMCGGAGIKTRLCQVLVVLGLGASMVAGRPAPALAAYPSPTVELQLRDAGAHCAQTDDADFHAREPTVVQAAGRAER